MQKPIGMVRYQHKETGMKGKESKMFQMEGKMELMCCCCKCLRNGLFTCVLKPGTPMHGVNA